MKDLLQTRKDIKKRKPKFVRQDAHKKVRLGNAWRKPKGSDSKMRLCKRGYNKIVTSGYKSPAAVRGANKEGLQMVNLASLKELAAIDANRQCIIISSGVGKAKRIAMLEEAIKKNIKVENYRDPKAALERLLEEIEKRKASKQKTQKAKEEKVKAKEAAAKKKEEESKKQESPKKEDKKKSLDELASDDEKKKQEEKKDKDKLLIKKQ